MLVFQIISLTATQVVAATHT